MQKVLVSVLYLSIMVCCSGKSDVLQPGAGEEEGLIFRDAFVIGFDQCAVRQGKILAIVEPPDTILVYNLPDSVFTFPDTDFSNSQSDCLFAKDVLDKYPLRIKYRQAESREFLGYICPDYIQANRFKHLIGNRQFVIVDVEK